MCSKCYSNPCDSDSVLSWGDAAVVGSLPIDSSLLVRVPALQPVADGVLWCFVIVGTRWCVMMSGTLSYPSASSDGILFTWPSALTWPSSSGVSHNYMMAGTLTYPSASDDGVLFTWPSLLTWPTVSSVRVMWWMVHLRDLQSVMLMLHNGWYTYTTFSQWWWCFGNDG